MEMTIEMAKDADLILEIIIEKGSADFFWFDLKHFNNHPKGYSRILFGMMNTLEPGVVMESDNEHSIMQTAKTETFFRQIGFSRTIKEKLDKKKLDEEYQKMLKMKAIHDYKISKWKVKTHWPAFILSILAFLISLFNLFRK